MKTKSYAAGQFAWVDLMANDPRAATELYGGLFGWKAVPQDTKGGPPYFQFQIGEDAVAGLGEMNEELKAAGVPPMWTSYVAVDDVEAAARKIEAAGGRVTLPPMKVLDAGWMAMFTDPAGAGFAVWKAGEHHGADLVNEPGSFCWNELYTPDVEGAKGFYGEVFGWTFAATEDNPAVTLIETGGRDNGTVFDSKTLPMEMPPFWMVYFTTADLDASLARLESLGGRVDAPAMEIAPGLFAVVSDTEGAPFVLFEMRS